MLKAPASRTISANTDTMPPRKRAREADADGNITLSSPHETNPLQQALAAQWRKHQFCDITITVEDSSFKAHRCVLAACSDFMGSLLSGGFADSSSPTISLPGVPATVFEAALAFCYEGQCTLPDEAALEAMLAAAARLQILDLRAATASALEAQLSASNCLAVWSLAEHHSLPTLGTAAQHTAARAFESIAADAAFTTLPLTNLEALLQDRHLIVDEIQVFRAVVAWLRAQPEGARTPDAVAALIKHIRFGTLSLEFLQAEVNPEPLMQSAPALQILSQCMMEKAHSVRTARMRPRALAWDASGAGDGVSVEGDTITMDTRRGHIVPAGAPITHGTHEFRLKLVEDCGEVPDEAASGVGFVSATSPPDDLDMVLPMGVDGASPEGLWWLRRFQTLVYSNGQAAEDNGDEEVEFPVGAEVRMVLDMDKGHATFFIDGTELPTKATGITRPVRLCAVSYDPYGTKDDGEGERVGFQMMY